MDNKTYSELLKHPKWQRRRLEILSRDNFTCQYCGDTETQLQVHHIKYEKNISPLDASPQYLITLCQKCHFNVTFLKQPIESVLYYLYIHAEIDQQKKIRIRNTIMKMIKHRDK